MVVTCDGDVFEGKPGQPARCGRCKRPYDGVDLIRLKRQTIVAEAAA
jgi:hypothetical protein